MYKLICIDDKTWAYEDTMPDGDSVRFFVADGKEKCLVIDSGYLPIDVHEMVKELLKKEGRYLTEKGEPKQVLLANTHADMDHSGGNASFPAFYMTREDYEINNLKEQCPDSLLIPAEEGTEIELGGRKFVYYMAPGHTAGNAVLLDSTNRALFPGDMVQTGRMFMFGPHRRPEKMAESLKKLIGMRDLYDRVYACHAQMILSPDAVDETLKAWIKAYNREVPSERKEVYGTEVDLYDCGFCRFFRDIE